MSTKTYPNLELLEYIFRQKIPPYDKQLRDVDIYVFPQKWPNTGGGTAEAGYLYGQAFTTQYTTVLVSEPCDIAMICFDDMPAYMVTPLTPPFWEDLARMNMKGLARRHTYDPEPKEGDASK